MNKRHIRSYKSRCCTSASGSYMIHNSTSDAGLLQEKCLCSTELGQYLFETSCIQSLDERSEENTRDKKRSDEKKEKT